jgi:hypothetical protein
MHFKKRKHKNISKMINNLYKMTKNKLNIKFYIRKNPIKFFIISKLKFPPILKMHRLIRNRILSISLEMERSKSLVL